MLFIPKHYVAGFAVTLFFSVILVSCSKTADKTTDTPPVVTPPPVDTTPSKKWIVSTIAGSGMEGYSDGDSTNAVFHAPQYLAMDTKGDLFVSDVMNFVIRKITLADKKVTTYAGRGISTPELPFGNIYALQFGKDGSLYDIEYNIMRKIVSPTQSNVFVGGPEIMIRDGLGTDARFAETAKMAIDKSGNFYLPDYKDYTTFLIRKVTPEGQVTTLTLTDNTGISSGSSRDLGYIISIAVDNSGNIYFTANGNNLIKKADPSGNVTIFAGAGDIGLVDGKGRDAKFNDIACLYTDEEGNLFVADAQNNAVRKITPDGTVTTIAGMVSPGFKDGDGDKAQFLGPSAVLVKNGIVYVADAYNNRIRKIEYK